MVLGVQNYGTKIFIYFTFKSRDWEGSKDSANGINVHSNINLDLKQNCKISVPQNKKFPVLRFFGLRMISMFGST